MFEQAKDANMRSKKIFFIKKLNELGIYLDCLLLETIVHAKHLH